MKIKNQGYLSTLYMVLFQSAIGPQWDQSQTNKETNSSLDTFTEQTIFNFLPGVD